MNIHSLPRHPRSPPARQTRRSVKDVWGKSVKDVMGLNTLKPKGAAPAQKQKKIPRAAGLVRTTKEGYGVAQGKSVTRLFGAARFRFKRRTRPGRAGSSKARGS